jgi:hypothetical protein
LRAAGRTFERARTGGGHATPLIEWLRDRSNRRLRQLSLSQDQRVRAAVTEGHSFSIRSCCSFFRYAGSVSGCQKRPLAVVATKKHHSFITVLIARENGSASTLWKYRP